MEQTTESIRTFLPLHFEMQNGSENFIKIIIRFYHRENTLSILLYSGCVCAGKKLLSREKNRRIRENPTGLSPWMPLNPPFTDLSDLMPNSAGCAMEDLRAAQLTAIDTDAIRVVDLCGSVFCPACQARGSILRFPSFLLCHETGPIHPAGQAGNRHAPLHSSWKSISSSVRTTGFLRLMIS